MVLVVCWLTELWTHSYLSLNNDEMSEILWPKIMGENRIDIYDCPDRWKICNLPLPTSYLMSLDMACEVLIS